VTAGVGAEWDVFVSYTQDDRAWAEWIGWQLEKAGWRILIQAWDFVPGTNWVHKMDEGVRRATRTVAVLSTAYLASVYGSAEWEAAWAADPLGQQRKLITVRVEECDRPGLLGQVVGVDLFGRSPEEARTVLVTAVRAAVEGHARPAVEPAFPVSEGGEAAPR
jgi:TIR domain